jgi:hypothetical protein
MDEPRLLLPGGGTDTPGNYVRLAALFMLLGLTATALPFLLVFRPPTHQVRVDLKEEPCGGPLEGYHRLDIGVHGSIALDGRPQGDLLGLREGLGRLALEPEPRLMLSAHPETRYEIFLEVLAMTRRAAIDHVRIVCAQAP